ncbi:hypothetical protein [Roseateles violae]|uniref:Uncharacterized protein n=1 Tax=Roseateles violae TaxID=3058042 RepID=A0ABT8DPE1_9BURK|nr:hypothetical protein [Pelomonas sp. PFR6]MDN3920210.1 hypothetical protein [Pelomonas sp. PFR6]
MMDSKDYLELLFAERVLAMATKLRSAAAPEAPAERSEWRKQHPVSEFVPVALARVREVAEIIRIESLPPRLTEALHESIDLPARPAKPAPTAPARRRAA